MENPKQNNKKHLLSKVADVTVFFWVIKIISTTAGEAGSDFFVSHFGFSAIIAALVALLVSVFVQIKFKRYVPWMYWTVIVLVAIFGTMFSDCIHHLGVSIFVSTPVFIVLLLAMLGIWYHYEKSLDVHNINTLRRELFYWGVIFFTFTLGTAAGDMVAEGLKIGFLNTTLFFAAVIVIIPLLLFALRINNIALFWITYILTRPLGASAADWLAKPASHGGLGFGDGITCLVSTGIIVLMIIYLTLTDREKMLTEENALFKKSA